MILPPWLAKVSQFRDPLFLCYIFLHISAGDASALCGWLSANAGHVAACVLSCLTHFRVLVCIAELIFLLAYACHQWAVHMCDISRPFHPNVVELGKETRCLHPLPVQWQHCRCPLVLCLFPVILILWLYNHKMTKSGMSSSGVLITQHEGHGQPRDVAVSLGVFA